MEELKKEFYDSLGSRKYCILRSCTREANVSHAYLLVQLMRFIPEHNPKTKMAALNK